MFKIVRKEVLNPSVKLMEIETPFIARKAEPGQFHVFTGLETQKWGGIIVEEETGATSKKAVYAGGDAVTGAAIVILAMGAGKKAAKAIDEFLKG